MNTAKNDVFIGFQLGNCYLVMGGLKIEFWWGRDKNLVGESLLRVGGVKGVSNFSAGDSQCQKL